MKLVTPADVLESGSSSLSGSGLVSSTAMGVLSAVAASANGSGSVTQVPRWTNLGNITAVQGTQPQFFDLRLDINNYQAGDVISFPDNLPIGWQLNVDGFTLEFVGGAVLTVPTRFRVQRAGFPFDEVTRTIATLSSGASWQLPTGHFIPTRIAAEIVNPRPDNERGTNSPYSHAYPGILNSYPISVRGGAYPFRYRIGPNSTLPGATIGETLTVLGDVQVRGPEYGVLSFTCPTSGGPWNAHIIVDDQDNLNVAEIEWTITRASTDTLSQYMVFDQNAGGANNGTITDPYNDWQTAFGTSSSSNVNAGRIVIFRGGVHNLQGFADSNGNLNLSGGGSPTGFMNYPGESPIIDMSSGFINFGVQNDTWVSGLHTRNNDTSDLIGRMFLKGGNNARFVFWRNHASGYFIGTSPGSNNPAVLYMGGNTNQYMTFQDNTLEGNVGAWIHLYGQLDTVVEGNRFSAPVSVTQFDSSLTAVIYFKVAASRVSIRANDCVNFSTTLGATSRYGVIGFNGSTGYRDIELCYNKVQATQFTGGRQGAMFIIQNTNYDFRDQLYAYRNTLDGRFRYDNSGGQPTITHERLNNVSTQSPSLGSGWTFSNESDNTDNGTVDSDGNLTGTTRTNFLGTRGAEIA